MKEVLLLVLRKNKIDNKVLFVDASKEFVRKDTKNKLSDENIMKILDNVRFKKEEKYFSKYVENEKISKNKYDLSVNIYVDTKDTRTTINIEDLNNKIDNVTNNVNRLRTEIDVIVKEFMSEKS